MSFGCSPPPGRVASRGSPRACCRGCQLRAILWDSNARDDRYVYPPGGASACVSCRVLAKGDLDQKDSNREKSWGKNVVLPILSDCTSTIVMLSYSYALSNTRYQK